MKRLQTGIVLLTTLLMMAILSLLVLSLMQSVWLYLKTNNQLIHQHDAFYGMEAVLNRLDFKAPDCVVHQQTPNQLINAVGAHQGCTYTEKKRHFTYIIEELEHYPCLQIDATNGIQGSQHWLITVASDALPNVILQVRYAVPIETEACLLGLPHRIRTGVLSWRKVSV